MRDASQSSSWLMRGGIAREGMLDMDLGGLRERKHVCEAGVHVRWGASVAIAR
jgi:hypothetical protein